MFESFIIVNLSAMKAADRHMFYKREWECFEGQHTRMISKHAA
jgi:hypothetical protein